MSDLTQIGEHLIAWPTDRPPTSLVVFLGGTGSTPANYRELTAAVGAMGHAVINLRYPNADAVGMRCLGDDRCFGQARGVAVFGTGVEPAPGVGPFACDGLEVQPGDSIVGRLVGLLATQIPGAKAASFLRADPTSPYVADGVGPAMPDWERTIVAGHSQGGGHAAFLATHVLVQRVVMLASPNDHVDGRPATWMAPCTTPPDRFRGIRHANEGLLGQHVPTAWKVLGGGHPETDIGDGADDPRGGRLLVVHEPDVDIGTNHSCVAVDGVAGPAMAPAWASVFSRS